MEKSQNYVELWGTAGAAPSFSHENHGESFYRFPLRVERLSGQSDLPLILAPPLCWRVPTLQRARPCA